MPAERDFPWRSILSRKPWLLRVALLVLAGCATSAGPLYSGPVRDSSQVVTVHIASWPMYMKISVDGKWVDLENGASVLPGTYEVSVLSNCMQSDPPGTTSAALEHAGFPHQVQASVHDKFTADAGNTVTYYWFADTPKVQVSPGGAVQNCAGFTHSVAKTVVTKH